jgi:Na+-transporting methylmalonyl-CoA/oxaloacetate decarboxylase gamma subunit
MTNEVSSAIPTLSTPEAIVYLLYGFSMVMLTLMILWFATAAVSKILKALGLDKMPAPQAVPPPPGSAIADETIAVITAAVAFATGGKFAIKSISKKS